MNEKRFTERVRLNSAQAQPEKGMRLCANR